MSKATVSQRHETWPRPITVDAGNLNITAGATANNGALAEVLVNNAAQGAATQSISVSGANAGTINLQGGLGTGQTRSRRSSAPTAITFTPGLAQTITDQHGISLTGGNGGAVGPTADSALHHRHGRDEPAADPGHTGGQRHPPGRQRHRLLGLHPGPNGINGTPLPLNAAQYLSIANGKLSLTGGANAAGDHSSAFILANNMGQRGLSSTSTSRARPFLPARSRCRAARVTPTPPTSPANGYK